MKKSLCVFLPNGETDNYKEGKDDVLSIRMLSAGIVSIMYEYMDGECKVSKETVYSGMPFILSDF